MEENQFFEEMKPLLKDYVEFTKEDMSEKWENMEKEALAKVEESQVRLDEAKQRQNEAIKNRDIFDEVMPRLKTLGEKVYKPVEDERRENQKKLEEYARQYNSRNKELAQANEEVEQTRARIEEEKQERMNTQKEKQESVYAKAKEYIASSKEKMEQDIKDKSDKLEEVKKQYKSFENEKKIAMKLKSKLEKESEEVKSTETFKKMYTVADEESKKRIQELSEHSKVINQAMEELEGARNTLASFETKYDVIDFASEAGIQSLIEITGWEEENIILEEQGNDLEERDTSKETEEEVEEETIHKLIEDEVEVVEDNKTDLSKQEIDRILSDENIETVDETQKQTIGAQEETPVEEPEKDWNKMTEEEKWQAIKAIYEEREEGREDLLSPDYLVLKYQNLAMKDVDEAMKIAVATKGKSLVEIYENCLGKLEKDHPHYIRLEKLFRKVKERNEELLMTESNEGELSLAEMASLVAKNGEKKCLVAALELMHRKVEQNFEDLLTLEYIQMKRMEMGKVIESYSEEQVKKKLLATASKTLKDICLEQLEIAKQEKDKVKIKELTRMIKRVEKREKSLQKSNEQNSEQQTLAGQSPAPQVPTEQKTVQQTPAGQKPAPQVPTEQKTVQPTPTGQNPVPQAPTEQKPIEQQSGQGKSGMSQILQSGVLETFNKRDWKEQLEKSADKSKVKVAFKNGMYIANYGAVPVTLDYERYDEIANSMKEEFLGFSKEDMDRIDMGFYKLLRLYDEQYDSEKAFKYVSAMVADMTDKERKDYLKANGIKMKYNFNGIRKKEGDTIIEKIKENATNSKEIATVKKEGLVSKLGKKLSKLFSPAKRKASLKSKQEESVRSSSAQSETQSNRSPRENLGMEEYDINHESAIQHAQEGRKEERAPIIME